MDLESFDFEHFSAEGVDPVLESADGYNIAEDQAADAYFRRTRRRRHRNSKLGCKECKRRRIKCDETLPSCENCRKRQQRGKSLRCSYLDMTDGEVAKFQFLQEQNRKNSQKLLSESSRLQSPRTSVTKTEALAIATGGLHYEVPLIAHGSMKLQRSFFLPIVGVEGWKGFGVAYLHSVLTAIQDWEISSKAFICVSIHHIINSMEIKIKFLKSKPGSTGSMDDKKAYRRNINALQKIASRYKLQLLTFVRNFICTFLGSKELIKDDFTASRLLMASSCFQYIDYYTNSVQDDSHYIAIVDMCLEIHKNNNPNKISRTMGFICKTFPYQVAHLHSPPCSSSILFEILQVLEDFKVHVRAAGDSQLTCRYETMREFLQYVATLLPHANSNGVMAFPPSVMFHISKKWTLNNPSEAYCITASTPGVHKVFYTFYHSIASYLDNLLPSLSYVMHRPLYASLGLYPYSLESIFDGLDKKLGSFAVFSVRLLSLMERRQFILHGFLDLGNTLPDDIENYRFKSRSLKNVNEVPVRMLNNSTIKWNNYPHVMKLPNEQWPKNGQGSFYCTEKEIVSARLKQLQFVESTGQLHLENSNAHSETFPLYERFMQTINRLSPLSDEDETITPSPASFEYRDVTGRTLNARGLFEDDCDISLLFSGIVPSIFTEDPSAEFIIKFKEDRIALLAATTEHLQP